MASLFQCSRGLSRFLTVVLLSPAFTATAEEDQVAVLKRFVSTPQIVKSVAFERTVPVARTNDLQLIVSEELTELYFGRWQSGSIFLRQVSDWSELDDHSLNGILVSAHLGDQWLMTTNSKFADHWIGPLGSGTMEDNYIQSEVMFQSRLFSEALNFGVMYAAPGSLIWNGDDFKGNGEVPLLKVPVQIEGKLNHSNGVPKSFRIIYRYPKTLVEHHVNFGYTKSPVEGLKLPAEITILWTDGKKERELSRMRLLTLELQTNSIPSELFEIQTFVETNSKAVRVIQGASRYLVLTNGALKYLDSLRSREERRGSIRPNIPPPPSMYLSWAGLNLGILLLSVKVLKNKNNKGIK